MGEAATAFDRIKLAQARQNGADRQAKAAEKAAERARTAENKARSERVRAEAVAKELRAQAEALHLQRPSHKKQKGAAASTSVCNPPAARTTGPGDTQHTG